MKNLYRLLGLLPTATLTEVKDAYVQSRAALIASKTHPAELSSALQELESAYAVLSDPGERARYDRSLSELGESEPSTALTYIERPVTILRPEIATPQVQQVCPYCGAPNPIQASICIQCKQQMTRPCPNCGHPVLLTQPVCSRCNTFVSEYDQKRLVQALVVEQKTNSARLESETRVQALESQHRVRAAHGVLFWTLVVLSCVVLAVLPIFIYNYVLSNP